MVLTAYIALSPVTGLFCHRHSRRYLHELDTSVGVSGPHDFAVRLRAVRQWHYQRPPHPIPRSWRPRSAPRAERDGDSFRSDLGETRSGIFLQMGLDGFLPDGQISCWGSARL